MVLNPSSWSMTLLGVTVLLAIAPGTVAESQVIRLVTVEEHQGVTRHYYTDVLAEAFARLDGDYRLEFKGDVPQVRAERMLDEGLVDVFWMVESPERDAAYLSTDVGISNGFIGRRVLMIRPEDQALFVDVQTLDDFRALDLVAGFGEGWIDGRVWGANNLKIFEETGDWSVMFAKLSRSRGDFDYLSRSVKEIMAELESNPELVAEQHLLLSYARDEAFYVTPERTGLRDLLQGALQSMQQDGTLNRFMQQYWGDSIDALDLESRRVIRLRSPE